MSKKGRLWFPLDVDFWDDPDIIAVGESAGILFLRLIGYSKRHQLDGLVPMSVVRSLGGRRWRQKLEPLVDRGMVQVAPNVAAIGDTNCAHFVANLAAIAGASWCRIVAYLAWNNSSNKIEQRRAIDKEKKRAQRAAKGDVPGGHPAAVPQMSDPPESELESELESEKRNTHIARVPEAVADGRSGAPIGRDRLPGDPGNPDGLRAALRRGYGERYFAKVKREAPQSRLSHPKWDQVCAELERRCPGDAPAVVAKRALDAFFGCPAARRLNWPVGQLATGIDAYALGLPAESIDPKRPGASVPAYGPKIGVLD